MSPASFPASGKDSTTKPPLSKRFEPAQRRETRASAAAAKAAKKRAKQPTRPVASRSKNSQSSEATETGPSSHLANDINSIIDIDEGENDSDGDDKAYTNEGKLALDVHHQRYEEPEQQKQEQILMSSFCSDARNDNQRLPGNTRTSRKRKRPTRYHENDGTNSKRAINTEVSLEEEHNEQSADDVDDSDARSVKTEAALLLLGMTRNCTIFHSVSTLKEDVNSNSPYADDCVKKAEKDEEPLPSNKIEAVGKKSVKKKSMHSDYNNYSLLNKTDERRIDVLVSVSDCVEQKEIDQETLSLFKSNDAHASNEETDDIMVGTSTSSQLEEDERWKELFIANDDDLKKLGKESLPFDNSIDTRKNEDKKTNIICTETSTESIAELSQDINRQTIQIPGCCVPELPPSTPSTSIPANDSNAFTEIFGSSISEENNNNFVLKNQHLKHCGNKEDSNCFLVENSHKETEDCGDAVVDISLQQEDDEEIANCTTIMEPGDHQNNITTKVDNISSNETMSVDDRIQRKDCTGITIHGVEPNSETNDLDNKLDHLDLNVSGPTTDKQCESFNNECTDERHYKQSTSPVLGKDIAANEPSITAKISVAKDIATRSASNGDEEVRTGNRESPLLSLNDDKISSNLGKTMHVTSPSSSRKTEFDGMTVISSLKVNIYAEASRVHRGKGVARLFSEYLERMELFLTSSSNFNRCCCRLASTKAGVSALDNGNSESIESFFKIFLKTKKMRQIHNRLIMALMKQSMDVHVPREQFLNHIPIHWSNKITEIRDAVVDHEQVEPYLLEIEKQREILSDQINNLKSSFSAESGLWAKCDTSQQLKPPPLCDIDAGMSLASITHPSLLPSAPVPGALAIDPLVRKVARREGLSLEEHALWLIIIATRQLTENILQQAIDIIKSDENAFVLAAKNGLRQAHNITILNLVQVFAKFPKIVGEFTSRVILDRLLCAAGRKMLPCSLDAPPLIESTIVTMIKEASSKRGKMVAPLPKVRESESHNMMDVELHKMDVDFKPTMSAFAFKSCSESVGAPETICSINAAKALADESPTMVSRRGRGGKDLSSLRPARTPVNTLRLMNAAMNTVKHGGATLTGEAGNVQSDAGITEHSVGLQLHTSQQLEISLINALSSEETGSPKVCLQDSVQEGKVSPLPSPLSPGNALTPSHQFSGRRAGAKDLAALKARRVESIHQEQKCNESYHSTDAPITSTLDAPLPATASDN